MLMLVSLEQASNYVHRDTTADDAELSLLVAAASQAVALHLASGSAYLDFLDSDLEAVQTDSDGVAQEVPPVVQAATLFLTGWLYRNRDADPENVFKDGFMPYPVRLLLGPLRSPVMA